MDHRRTLLVRPSTSAGPQPTRLVVGATCWCGSVGSLSSSACRRCGRQCGRASVWTVILGLAGGLAIFAQIVEDFLSPLTALVGSGFAQICEDVPRSLAPLISKRSLQRPGRRIRKKRALRRDCPRAPGRYLTAGNPRWGRGNLHFAAISYRRSGLRLLLPLPRCQLFRTRDILAAGAWPCRLSRRPSASSLRCFSSSSWRPSSPRPCRAFP